MCPTAVAAPSEAVSGQRRADKQRQINRAGCILRLLYGWRPLKWITNGSDGGGKKKKDKLPQGRQQPVCLTRAGERGGIKMGAQWEAGWGRSERREQQRRGKWVGNHEKCHFWGTLEGRSSERSARWPPGRKMGCGRVGRIFPPTRPTRKTANTPTFQRWRRQRSEHRRCRARKSVINVSPALYFLSDQKVARERRPRGQTGNSKRVPMRAKKKTLLSRDVWTFCLCLRFSPCCFRSVDCADTSSNAHHTGASAAQRSNSGGQSCTKLIYKSSPPGATQTGCYNQLISVSFVGLGGFKSNIVQLIWPFE